MELHFFDRNADYAVIERLLPHWLQPGVVCFLTFRTDDSIPLEVAERWRSERGRWLRVQGINPTASDWRHQLQKLDKLIQAEFYQHFSKRWHDELDACHGACVLRCRKLADIVGNSLHHFDGVRYELLDFIVMPNHVHVLVVFLNETAMLAQCDSWKHFTAYNINRELQTNGRFWQQDGFDHLVMIRRAVLPSPPIHRQQRHQSEAASARVSALLQAAFTSLLKQPSSLRRDVPGCFHIQQRIQNAICQRLVWSRKPDKGSLGRIKARLGGARRLLCASRWPRAVFN